MKHLGIWIIISVVAVMGFSSCGGKGKHSSSQDRKFIVGICIAQETEATRLMHEAIDRRAPAENASVIWASAEENEAAQERIVQNFIDNGVQGIILDPVNPLTAGLLIDNAAYRGIPVAGITALPETRKEGVFIRPDFKTAGENLVRSVIQNRRKPGKILILIAELSDSIEMALVHSMLGILRENASEYQVYGLSTDSSIARKEMNTILFSPSPPSAVIATRISYGLIASDLFRLGLVSPRPIIANYSDQQRAKDALQDGKIDILGDPQPGVVGTTALSSIISLIRQIPLQTDSQRIQSGEFSTPVIKTPVQFTFSPHPSR